MSSETTENRAKERQLARIATQGVTQLFNTVAERQKLVDKKLDELQKLKERSKQRKVVEEIKSNDFHASLFTKLKPVEPKVKNEVKEEVEDDSDLDEDIEIDDF